MGMSKRRMPQEKARIVLEFLNTSTSAAELCRKYSISPATFQDWKDKFMAGGKQALAGRGDVAKIHTKEVENLKRIIGEITVANDILKKNFGGRKTMKTKAVNEAVEYTAKRNVL